MDQEQKGWVQRSAVAENGTAAKAPQPASAGAATPDPRRREATFVDQGAEFEGVLRLTESFRIDCEFRGEIVSEARVVVGESAGIEANIVAREVIIAGAVVGNVTASRQVILRAGARLHGNVETPSFELEKGAFFNGQTTMARPEATLRADASVSADSPAAETAAAADPETARPVPESGTA